MQGQVERRRGRRQHTIDQPFDGNEGWIAWYCQYINGKIYPVVGRFILYSTFPPLFGTIKQIEKVENYLCILNTNGELHIRNLLTGSLARMVGGVKKIITKEINFSSHIIILFDNGRIVSYRVSDFTAFFWFQGEPTLTFLDISLFQDRIFLLRQEGDKNVLYFSKQFLRTVPNGLFTDYLGGDAFFTFPTNFFILPHSSQYILFKNYVITSNAVYTLVPKVYGNVLQYLLEFLFYLPAPLSNLQIQINKNKLFISDGNQTWDEKGERYDLSIIPFLSSQTLPVIKNNFYSSIIDDNYRLDFSNEMPMFKLGNYLISPIFLFYLSEGDVSDLFMGKLIFISDFKDNIHYKYLKKINIKEYQDIFKFSGNSGFLYYPPSFPSQKIDIITEEEEMQEIEWVSTRAVGISFQIEIEVKNGLLPILEVEYDEGR
jgi:hypothetical protein